MGGVLGPLGEDGERRRWSSRVASTALPPRGRRWRWILADHFSGVAGHTGFFVSLPTQATSNQMFGRVRDFLARAYPTEPRTCISCTATRSCLTNTTRCVFPRSTMRTVVIRPRAESVLRNGSHARSARFAVDEPQKMRDERGRSRSTSVLSLTRLYNDRPSPRSCPRPSSIRTASGRDCTLRGTPRWQRPRSGRW